MTDEDLFTAIEPPPQSVTITKSQIDVDGIRKVIRILIEISERPTQTTKRLDEPTLIAVCNRAAAIIFEQPVCLKLRAPIAVIGDIHGQYGDLLRIFKLVGLPPRNPFLFLGDYVDRGRQSIECIILLLAYKCWIYNQSMYLSFCIYPTRMFLLRGNHETAAINRMYGLYDECKYRYSTRLWLALQSVFNVMPFTALINDRILCMHGGISPYIKSLSDLIKIERPVDPPDLGIMTDILWADPEEEISGWQPNRNRRVSYVFGADVVTKFCKHHDIDLIARAHQVVEDGYEFFADRHLVTVFSAPNYCGMFTNAAALMLVDANLLCTFNTIKYSPLPSKFTLVNDIVNKEPELIPSSSPPDNQPTTLCSWSDDKDDNDASKSTNNQPDNNKNNNSNDESNNETKTGNNVKCTTETTTKTSSTTTTTNAEYDKNAMTEKSDKAI